MSGNFSRDFFGNPRPTTGAWTIGAYEYSDLGGQPLPVNGLCGAALNLCNSGTLIDAADTDSFYLWSCEGLNGGTSANCQKPKSPFPLDTDSDGVPDATDRCPKTAIAARNFVNVFGCAMPIATKFDIKPDFNATDINGMQNLELGISQYGKISYANKNLLLVKMSAGEDDRLDIDADLNISQGKITLNQNNLPQLNQAATITLYNTNFNSPAPLWTQLNSSSSRAR